MLEFMSLVRKIHPELFIHSIYVEEDLEKDQKAGWVGLKNFKPGPSLLKCVVVWKYCRAVGWGCRTACGHSRTSKRL